MKIINIGNQKPKNPEPAQVQVLQPQKQGKPEQKAVFQEFTNNLLDFEVQEKPIFNASGQRINGFKSIVKDTGEILHVCRDSYHPIPNLLFSQLVSNLAQNTGLEYKEAVAIKNDKVVLAYLQDRDRETADGHRFGNKMIIGNAHDGSSAFFVGTNTVMHRCTNMLNSTKMGLKVYHRSDANHRINQVQAFFNKYKDINGKLFEFLNRLAGVKVNNRVKEQFIDFLLQVDSKQLNKESTRKQNTVNNMRLAIERETAAIGQTAHGLLQGVTYFTTHVRKVKEPIYNGLFGQNKVYQERAVQFLDDLKSTETQHFIN